MEGGSRRADPVLVALGLLLAAGSVAVAFSSAGTGDYVEHDPGGLDNPAPAIRALIDGDWDRFGAVQPLMGLFSLLLRAPLVALGGGLGTSYRLGAVPCMLAAGALGLWLAARARADGAPRLAWLLAPALCLASPASLDAIRSGHPEEVLAGALAVGAVLSARSNRGLPAAALLGLAVGTKQWALLATPAVILAVPGPVRHRALVGAGAAVLALALCLPGPLIDRPAYTAAARAVGNTHAVNAASPWWLAHAARHRAGAPSAEVLPGGLTRSQASALIAIALAALLLVAVRRGACEPLALLAATLILRCAFDPQPLGYYYAPAVLALAAWEVVDRRRMPVAALLAAAGAWLSFDAAVDLSHPAQQAVYEAWALPLVAYVVVSGVARTRRSASPAARSTSVETSDTGSRNRPST